MNNLHGPGKGARVFATCVRGLFSGVVFWVAACTLTKLYTETKSIFGLSYEPGFTMCKHVDTMEIN